MSDHDPPREGDQAEPQPPADPSGTTEAFPGWAAERDAPHGCPTGYCHLERAVMRLARAGIALCNWPMPYEYDRATKSLRKIGDHQRAEGLKRQCFELQCQLHDVLFAIGDIDNAIKLQDKPRWGRLGGTFLLNGRPVPFLPQTLDRIREKHGIGYICADGGNGAIAWLLREGVLPSNFPDVFLCEEDSELHRVACKSRWIRRHIHGAPAPAAFMRQEQIECAIEIQRRQDLDTKRGSEPPSTGEPYKDKLARRLQEIASQSSESESQLPSDKQLSLQWHSDLKQIVSDNLQISTKEAFKRLVALPEYDEDGNDGLLLPGSGRVAHGTFQNVLTQIKKALRNSRS